MTKKILLISSALLLLTIAMSPNAQALSPIRFGIKAGIQTQSLKMDGLRWSDLSKSNNFGYQLGAMIQVPLGPVYLQPEIVYNSARFNLNGNLLYSDGGIEQQDVRAKYAVNTVQLPVLVGIKILFLRVFAGPTFNLLTDTSNKSGKQGVTFPVLTNPRLLFRWVPVLKSASSTLTSATTVSSNVRPRPSHSARISPPRRSRQR